MTEKEILRRVTAIQFCEDKDVEVDLENCYVRSCGIVIQVNSRDRFARGFLIHVIIKQDNGSQSNDFPIDGTQFWYNDRRITVANLARIVLRWLIGNC